MRYAVLTIAAVLLSSCGHDGGHEGGVLRQVRQHQAPSTNGSVRIDAAFDNTTLVPVTIQGQQFTIRSREQALDKFPCQRCHKVPLAQMKHDGKDGKPRAHWNVKLQHAGEEVMACATCHLPDDFNQLRTLTNKPVALNQSHVVCAQCHSKQAADWAGGAHGKRVGGWAPPRVSQTCAECHNPHKPAWDQRLPAHVTRREDKPGHE